MARQAEAERERRAKVIAAEGELPGRGEARQAADVIRRNPAALQLRYLQTLVEIAAEKNSTIIFPVPIRSHRVVHGEERRSGAAVPARRSAGDSSGAATAGAGPHSAARSRRP